MIIDAFAARNRAPASASERLRFRASMVALLAFGASAFVGIGHPLQNVNEGLYARVAQEMLASGQWVIPTLDGVPYLEKPPLLYWLCAGALGLFGSAEWAARLPAVLGALLMLGAVRSLARPRAGEASATAAVAILASSPLALLLGRTLMFDALYAGLFAWSLVGLHQGLAARDTRWIRASYVFLALAVLTKGFAVVLFFALIAAGAAWLVFPPSALRVLRDPGALATFFALTIPWHLAASLQDVGFAWFYFMNEHVLRFLGARVPADYHTGPWWYYLPRLARDAAPWTLLLLVPRASPLALATPEGRLRAFLWLWVLVPLVVLSLSGNKGEYYMLVSVPALAVLLALRLRDAGARRILAAVPLAAALAALGGALYATSFPVERVPQEAPLLFALAALIALAAAVAMHWRRTVAGVLLLAAASLAVAMLYSGIVERNESLRSAKTLARQAAELGRPIFIYRDFEQLSALAFYLGRPVGVIDSDSSDLAWGLKVRPDRERFPDAAGFVRAVEDAPAVVVVRRERLAEFDASAVRWKCRMEGGVRAAVLFTCG